jgi:hypothetical protein
MFGLLCFSLLLKAQVITQATTPSTIGSIIPGYSQVTSYNTKTISYTRSTPDPTPTPVDGDTTTEYIKKYDYANPLSVSISMSDGNITSTSVGKVWTLRISVPNALNIGITFNQFNLSSTAETYIFNEARTVVKGKILKSYFSNTTGVTTSPMATNSIIVYIVEPNNFGTLQSIISIQKIMAGYQPIDDVGTVYGGGGFKPNGTVTINGASVNCDPLIMCTPGKLATARAVARFYTGNGFEGTGTLINNEANNGRAFFVTAFHMLDVNSGLFGGHPGNNVLDAGEIAALQNSVVQFQFWRTECDGTINNTSIDFYGTTLRTSSVASDFVLLELLNPPGIGDGVNYAGWNRGTTEPNDDVSFIIHHPQGEDMRITTTRDVKTFFWNNDFWSAHYSSGTVDKGSSGSALFNQNNQIVGQLRSGWSNCNYTSFGDRYGKLSRSWAFTYANLQPWLSPNQNLQSMYSLDLFPLTIQGTSTLSCGATGGNAQFTVPANLLGCTYYWTVGTNLQIISGQGTGILTVKGTQTSDVNSYVQVQISDSKGRNRTATATKNLTLLAGAPTVYASGSPSGACNGNTQTWYLTANPASGSNWHWTVDYLGNGASIYIRNPYASSTYADVIGGGTVKLTYTDVCGTTQNAGGPTVYSNCHSFAYIMSPNPAQDNVTISSDNSNIKSSSQNKIYQIRITDALGTLKKSVEYKSGINTTQISLSGLNSGAYLVSVFDGTNWDTQQLIIQK